MYRFLCKTLLHFRNGYTLTPQNPLIGVSSSLRYLSTDANHHSCTFSYLVNTCGLSPESALSASRKVQFETPDNADLVISFFKKLGFSKTQISEIIEKNPKLLATKSEKIIFPKVEFFRSKGASNPDLVRILTSYPWILQRSLDNHLIPSFNFYKELLQSEERAIAAITRCPVILYPRLQDGLIHNIHILRENGVPSANILLLVQFYARMIGRYSDKFGKIVEEVKEMGFDPLKSAFVIAIVALTRLNKCEWDRKVDTYKRWGWSDKDVMTAFRKYPWCMTISEDKIMSVMDFFVNRLGLDSSVISNRPELLSVSLVKRLIPRAAVVEFLSSKGRVKLDSTIIKLFLCTEKRFLEKFVDCQVEASQLLKLYNEKLDLLKHQGNKQNM